MIKCFEQIKTVGIYSPGFKADIIYVQFSEIDITKTLNITANQTLNITANQTINITSNQTINTTINSTINANINNNNLYNF